MSTMKLTLIGLNNYDDDLWNNLTVPSGIDKDTLINTILVNGGEFEVLYPQPDYLKMMIGFWSQKWAHTMERWVKLIGVDYDPLNNYDRTEEYTDTTHNTGTATDTSSNSYTGSTEGKVSAFDSSEYQPHDTTTASNTTTASIGNTSQSDGTLEHEAHLYGNIGVTTSQDMWLAEKDVLKVNMYNEIANLFLQEFVIPIY